MSTSEKRSIVVNRHKIDLSNESKLYFPHSGITKGEVIAYYEAIAPYMIPYLKNRPLSMVRYPDGIAGEHFFQKNVSDHYPSWIKRIAIPKADGGENIMTTCNDAATLIYLANQACLTPHLWLSKVDKLNYPDRLIFDLDPADTQSFTLVRTTALALKDILESMGLFPFAMTTGSRGMHVVVPIKRTHPFDKVREIALSIANACVAQNPDHLTTNIRKEQRQGRLFIDCNRNAFAQTSVAPYAIRAYEHAPVAAPISWDEVKDVKLTAQRYTIHNVVRKIENNDAWKGIAKMARVLKNMPS